MGVYQTTAGVSLADRGCVLFAGYRDPVVGKQRKQIAPLDRPNVTYITTLDENRSDEEILASNIENQRVQDERRAQIEAIEERKREMYRALGAASGMNVEAMEEQAAAERAREEAAREALRREVLENRVVPGAADAAVRGGDQ